MAETATNGTASATNGDANGTPSHDIDPEVKHLVFEWITDTLHKAWLRPEAEKKRAVKQLFLKWHPDKNADDPKLALEATQHIQKEVERMEMGLPRSRSRYNEFPSSYASYKPTSTADKSDARYQSYYDDFMSSLNRKREEFKKEFEERDRISRMKQEERDRQRDQARRERERQRRDEEERADEEARLRREEFKREQAERRRERELRYGKPETNDEPVSSRRTPTRDTNGSSSASSSASSRTSSSRATNPNRKKLTDEEMVEGLLRQSEHDIKSAENDMGGETTAYEWACFKAHQGSEKALKALQFFRIGLKSNSHELTSLAATLRDADLMDLASNVQEKIGGNNKLYNMILSDFSLIPHDDYTVEMALEAVTSAKDILERVKTLIDSPT